MPATMAIGAKLYSTHPPPSWQKSSHHSRPSRHRLGMAFLLAFLAVSSLYTFAGASTFSIPTASTANPTASGVSVKHGKAYIEYSTVPGFFLQDLNSTNQTTFDYTTVNFGLLNRTYPDEPESDCRLPQWARFNRYLKRLNRRADPDTAYKLLFIGRHGNGYHNAAESFYGTPAWNCYWAEANGNSTTSWVDARLTALGISQAQKANTYWTRLITEQQITPPMTFYVSPLTRCLQTAQTTFANLTLPQGHPYAPKIKEFLRESISTHTCDHRSNKTAIAAAFPGYTFDFDFSESDEFWNGVTAETNSAQDYRSTYVLDDIFSTDRHRIISFTTHSGETASLLRVLGHIPFSLGTGQVIPVLVKAQTIRSQAPATTTMPWTASAWCTNAPPVTSLSSGGCSCQNGVTPTAVAPGTVFTTNPARL